MQGITALQPEGFSVDNVCKVTLAVRPRTSASYVNYQEGSEEVGKNYLRIIERLKMHPDVGTVAFFGPHSAPFNYSSNSRTCWNDTVSAVNSLRYTVTPDYFRVFDIHAVDGGSPDLLADALADGWVVSRTLEEKLVDGAHLQGKRLAWDNKGDSTTYRVNGITVPIKKQGFDQPRPVVFTLLTEKDLYEADERELGQMQIAFRLRSGVTGSSDYAASFKTEMKQSLAAGNFWLADVQYYPDIRGKFLDNTMQVNGQRLNIAVNAFLLVNVFLAVIGTFWFRVNRRKGELGSWFFPSHDPATGRWRRVVDPDDCQHSGFAALPEHGLCRYAQHGGDEGDLRTSVSCQPVDLGNPGRHHLPGNLVSVPQSVAVGAGGGVAL